MKQIKQEKQKYWIEHLLNGKVILSNILLYKKKIIGSIIHIMIDMIIIIDY